MRPCAPSTAMGREGLSDVAGELDVNQRTVYRRYKSRDDQ